MSQKIYINGYILVPHKTPRKSKKNPNPELTPEQKRHNSNVGRIRVFVENAIAGLKRYKVLVHDFRNKIKGFDDSVIAVSAGLWNMMSGGVVRLGYLETTLLITLTPLWPSLLSGLIRARFWLHSVSVTYDQ